MSSSHLNVLEKNNQYHAKRLKSTTRGQKWGLTKKTVKDGRHRDTCHTSNICVTITQYERQFLATNTYKFMLIPPSVIHFVLWQYQNALLSCVMQALNVSSKREEKTERGVKLRVKSLNNNFLRFWAVSRTQNEISQTCFHYQHID